jgi:hypothetical protein
MAEDTPSAPTPPETPVQPSRVTRQFEHKVSLAEMEIPDWGFIEKFVDLIQPYVRTDDDFKIRGRDNRGSYDARDLEAFREEYAARDEDLLSYSIRVYGSDEHGFFQYGVHYAGDHDSGIAELSGGDEIRVNGLAASVERLANAATTRRRANEDAARHKPELLHLSVTAPSPISSRTQASRWNHPWVVTVVGGVVAAVLAGLILLMLTH